MKTRGTLTYWDDEKGYGFVTSLADKEKTFIHISSFKNSMPRPTVHQELTYSLSTDKRGRLCAIHATYDDKKAVRIKSSKQVFLISTAIVFLAIVSISVLISKLPLLIFNLYLGTSTLTFFFYAADKWAAIRGSWRIKESTLQLLSLIGGWPGALIAQVLLRHKTQKQPFLFIFFIVSSINVCAFLYLFTSSGAFFLQTLVNKFS